MTKKILIVEDHADSRSFLKTFIKSLGYRVLEASNGIEAIKMAQADGPDLILMDLGMPELDGLSATKVIRGFEEGATVPIIAVTAYGVDNGQALEAGCSELLFKPLDPALIEQILGRYLGSGAAATK